MNPVQLLQGGGKEQRGVGIRRWAQKSGECRRQKGVGGGRRKRERRRMRKRWEEGEKEREAE